MNNDHGLPTQNYRRGQYKDVDKIDGEAVYNTIVKYEGKFGLACSPGCAIQCSNLIRDAEGNHVTSSLEYETIGLLGSNIMNNDVLKISRMDHLCKDRRAQGKASCKRGLVVCQMRSCIKERQEARTSRCAEAQDKVWRQKKKRPQDRTLLQRLRQCAKKSITAA